MNHDEQFKLLAEKIAPIIKLGVQQAYREQGHVLTGALINSIDYAIQATVTGAMIDFMMLDYSVPVNSGVPASRIPYSGRSGGGYSKYIAGLITYARLRFKVPAIEAKKIAFAIANKHKKEGMPTRASSAYSKNGKRTNAIQQGLDEAQDKVNDMIQYALETYINSIMIEAWSQVA